MTNCAISDQDFEHVLNFKKAFKMNIMKNCHDLYLKVYVLLLVCVFQTFKKNPINFFELDPAHYSSISGCSWDAMLRFTDVNLNLISDTEKYQFVEIMIRGDISMIYEGDVEAKYEFLKSYEVSRPTSYIIYLDANNLYS